MKFTRAPCMLIPRSSIRRHSQTKFVWKKVKFRLFYYFLELVGHRKVVSHSELPCHLCMSEIVEAILSKSVPKIYFTLKKIEFCHFTFFIKCLWMAGLKVVSKPAPFLWLRASFWIEKNFFTYINFILWSSCRDKVIVETICNLLEKTARKTVENCARETRFGVHTGLSTTVLAFLNKRLRDSKENES